MPTAPARLPRTKDRFGLRRAERHPAALFTALAARLRAMQDGAECPADRAFVTEVLQAPYWGLRVLAIGVIGAWGGRGNKAWLQPRAARIVPERAARRDKALRWAALETWAARRAIRPMLAADDAPWLLDTWFAGSLQYHPLTLAVVPDAVVDAAVGRERAAGDAARRTAALWLAYHRRSLPCRAKTLRDLAEDGDPAIARQAARMLAWDAATQGSAKGGLV